MARMGEYCREAEAEYDPKKIKPNAGRCIVRRKNAPSKKGSIIIPDHRKDQLDEGWIYSFKLEDGDEEYQDLRVEDHVWFSPNTNVQDSFFFAWKEVDYVLIPIEAIQLREKVAA